MNEMIDSRFLKARRAYIAKQFSQLAFYVIPDTVTRIEDSCFSDCEALTYVDIPSSVKEIGSLAFFKCKGKLVGT